MNGLRVSLKRKKFYRLGEPIRVKLVIRNIVPRTVYLLKRSIGLGEIDNTGFRIVNEETGEELPYEGWLVKRKKISKESYQRLGFLKKYEIEVVIADNYALTATGKYALS